MGHVFWLIVWGLCLLLEALTMGLATIWFAAGAFVTFLVTFFIEEPAIEWMIFLIVSLVSLLALRPLFIEKFNAKRKSKDTNSISGRTGIVAETIDNVHAKGSVTISGMAWSARNGISDEVIPAGARIRVLKVAGVKVLVEPIDE